MPYSIVLTTAEDIVAVVDAVVARGKDAGIDYIADFTGIATEDQVSKALHMAVELGLLVHNDLTGLYSTNSYLAKRLVTAASDDQKAAIMRLILEQYEPYKAFKTRYGFTRLIDLACKQAKSVCSINGNERDIKNTLISIATYAKALKKVRELRKNGKAAFIRVDEQCETGDLAEDTGAIIHTGAAVASMRSWCPAPV